MLSDKLTTFWLCKEAREALPHITKRSRNFQWGRHPMPGEVTDLLTNLTIFQELQDAYSQYDEAWLANLVETFGQDQMQHAGLI